MSRKFKIRPSLIAVAACCAAAAVFPAGAFAQGADLSIDKTDSADPVVTGTQFSYAITVANAGPDAATGVTLEDTLPNEVEFVSATASQGNCNLQGSKKVECALGSLASGASATATIQVLAQRDGQASNTASVSGSPADPVNANDSDTELTTIQPPPTVNCGGQEATIVGTAGPDTLTGTAKKDVIAGLDGDDVISGLDGDDIVCGGLGNDAVNVGAGNDVAKGGGGDDRVRGAVGNDSLTGNGGNDNLRGGAGDDALKGGPGTDACGGGGGVNTRRGCE